MKIKSRIDARSRPARFTTAININWCGRLQESRDSYGFEKQMLGFLV
ncbi:hypothetical protein IQ238_14380 [Pleurocapsales cyanobacterium LEGE 06147]|nr:hypothetical protein [Pleurocapsales cyanobacterium LEGE 06147]